MASQPTPTLAEELERFVREEAARFGNVISYVPVATQAVSTPTVTPTSLNLQELESRLKPFESEGWTNAPTLEILEQSIHNCQKCELWKTRKNFVFGTGNPHAKLMVIGEAPGADEDESGKPFVGRAGQLLTKMLTAINLERDEVFITNILKSRPPGNRDPRPEEVAACEPYLWKQIELIQPKLILCLGRIAGTNLLKIQEPLKNMRGNTYEFFGAQVIVTYHPAALLRNPDWKRGAWEDLQRVRTLYDTIA